MKAQRQFKAWVKNYFYALTVYATCKQEARLKIKESYGKFPYFIEAAK